MSLQVWLPLNGNLNNQGLDGGCSFTNSNAAVDSSGKIGSCYSFSSTTGDGIYLSGKSVADFMDQYINNHSFSTCAWIKTTSGYTTVLSLTYGWWIAVNYNVLSTTYYNSSRSIACNGTTVINDDRWHHICSTYDVSTNKMSVYVDGKLDGTNTYTSGYTYSSSWTNRISIGRNLNNSTASSWYFYQGKVNDVRIYDHCLSAKEVKEISQGLVLHYKLDDPYIEPTINYSPQTGNCGGWNNSGTATWTNDDISVIKPFYDSRVYSILKTAAGNSAITFGNTYTTDSNGLKGATVTASCYVWISSNNCYSNCIYLRSRVNDNKAGNTICYLNYNGSTNPQYWPKEKWIRVVGTGTIDSNESYVYFCDYINNIDEKRYYTAFQIEKGNKVTSFVNGSRSNYQLNDCSGYNNNEVNVDDSHRPTISTVKPIRYNKCYNFAPSQYIACGKGGKVTDEITVSIWAHMATWNNNTIRLVSCTESGGWNFEPDSSCISFPVYVSGVGYISCTSAKTWSSLSSGWHMFTGTYNGLESKLYIDGVLDKTVSNGRATKTPIGYYANNGIFIHAEAEGSETTPYVGWPAMDMSDFRIYATALSEEDIKSLYKTTASIDKNGNLHCYQLLEE